MASSSLSPNVVKTALDDVFYQNFRIDDAPNFGSVEDPMIFRQETSDSGAEIEEELKSGGYWGEKAETANASTSSSRTGNQVTYTHTEFAQTEDLPKAFFDDAKHGVVAKIIEEMALNGRATREKDGMSVFRNAFTAGFTGGDGATLCSDSHTLLDGSTQDNNLTATLAVSSLESAIVALAEQKSQAGVVLGMMPSTLLVPPSLFKEAVEITESKLISDSADNALNVYSAKYGIVVKQNPHLGTASGGSNSAWFLLGRSHGLKRFVREAINTTLVDWKYSRSHQYAYTGRFRESTGWSSHIGIVGSNGSV